MKNEAALTTDNVAGTALSGHGSRSLFDLTAVVLAVVGVSPSCGRVGFDEHNGNPSGDPYLLGTSCVDDSDCVDACRSENACIGSVCALGPVDKDDDSDGLVDSACPGGRDCDDTSGSCTAVCDDADFDSVWDCKDPCIDADDDGYGEDGGGGVCSGPDCDDTSSSCTAVCDDADLDSVWDCSDPCIDGDSDGYGVDGPTGTCSGPDCDDSDERENPGNAEGPAGTCADNLDNDCDTWVDNADTDCSGATMIFRSVGWGSTAARATGSGNPMTLDGATATFASALPLDVGVGDAIQYDSAGAPSDPVDSLVFIHGRASPTELTVRRADGTDPVDTTADQDWALYRAYTSLANAQNGNGNTGIGGSLRSQCNVPAGRDLVTPQLIWNVACYGDAQENDAPTISGWVTSPEYYLRIYTPVSQSEVGVSQRHNGAWSSNAYRIRTTAYETKLLVAVSYVHIVGLQVDTAGAGTGIHLSAAGPHDMTIAHNIIRGGDQANKYGMEQRSAVSASSITRIHNNIIYDFVGGSSYGVFLRTDNSTNYVYNNTVVDCDRGFVFWDAMTVIAKNNLSYGNGDNWEGSFHSSSTNNLSGPNQGGAPGDNPVNSASVAFADPAGNDFHLGPVPSDAHGGGVDLSSDPDLPIRTDIDGQTRTAPWDIGADER
ncbi:hypothetical protein ACFL6C_09095 [Myxococcota bacterium]